MTQREFFNVIVNGTGTIFFKDESGNTNFKDITRDDPEIVEFAKKQIEALGKKNSARNVKARAKRADENKPLVAQIKTILADGKAHTCVELSATTGANIPKVSSLISVYFKDTVVKETVKVDKKKAVAYRLAQ